MKAKWLTAGMFGLILYTSGAAILYVSPTSPNPVMPFANWDTAAMTIQDAIDAAHAGDRIIVTGNWAMNMGGGVDSCTVNNCTLVNNSADVYGDGGGASISTLTAR
ncbi:MAG TPA: hypothetical protein VLT36_26680 [Candidatus Dormibacteraeota bacterium]|nr:hypothetical protein [Candidatus Dormibacteraeota bacterium]